jgi:peptidoglycan/xylan/chitin deacetylase (PgdA/CDA1 family)
LSIRRRFHAKLLSVRHRIWPPKPKPLILMYHRIADDPVDHWGLAVSPTRFEEQLDVLRRTRYPLPLNSFIRDLKAGSLPENAVAVTFDDGYVDNLVAAKPRLAAADIPATVYLTTGFVGGDGGFWWDELARRILLENGRQQFDLVVRGEAVRFGIGDTPPLGENGNPESRSLRRRRETIMGIWQIVRRLDGVEREAVMVQLRAIFSGPKYRAWPDRAMTGAEVRALVADGLVTIGAHTVTHPVLAGLDPATCEREIRESKRGCEALIGLPVESFAYPYGAFDANAGDAVRKAGFTSACSVRHGPALAASDVFALPRIHVLNWGGDAFERALRSASAAQTS